MEFVFLDGETIAVVTVEREQIRTVGRLEIANERKFAQAQGA